MKKILSAVGVSVLGLGSTILGSPAFAVGLSDCGAAPAGGDMTENAGVCTLTFDASGTYSFTTPAAFTDLQALLTGGGGGAWVNGVTGYAGSGGKVKYVPLGTGAASKALTIVVGFGGPSDPISPTDGGDSTISYDSQTFLASRGYMSQGYCLVNGDSGVQTGVGNGAGGDTLTVDGEECVSAPGVNPSAGTPDSNGLAVPSLFTNYDVTLGKGGAALASPAALPVQTAGTAASVVMDLVTDTAAANDAKAADGLVVLRWSLPGVTPTPEDTTDTGGELPNTDISNWVTPLAVGIGIAAVGTAVVIVRKRRTKESNTDA